ncbi:hypothetical protein RJ639_012386 [Escallonia herrerae]|uniref:Uncharacterized protein n=1 Tax=Escallonia herrerae TaxID=1293975 RepID=A0AA89AR91_9ASTE|nr:hypothetical protein RJ639_012386 [Escallonia herrerae]
MATARDGSSPHDYADSNKIGGAISRLSATVSQSPIINHGKRAGPVAKNPVVPTGSPSISDDVVSAQITKGLVAIGHWPWFKPSHPKVSAKPRLEGYVEGVEIEVSCVVNNKELNKDEFLRETTIVLLLKGDDRKIDFYNLDTYTTKTNCLAILGE